MTVTPDCQDCPTPSVFRIDYRNERVFVCERHNDTRMDLRNRRSAVSHDLRPVAPELAALHARIRRFHP